MNPSEPLWQQGTNSREFYLKLTCGHYYLVHAGSSDLDFPDEAHQCPIGCGMRQFHLLLQVNMMNDMWGPVAV